MRSLGPLCRATHTFHTYFCGAKFPMEAKQKKTLFKNSLSCVYRNEEERRKQVSLSP
jgi:hypothetical protein